MKWRDMTIGRRIAFGFGVVLVLLTLTGVLTYVGVGGIVLNASEVIDGNKLDGELAQKEVDHLVWCKKVNALLTDDSIHELHVQTDDHKCGFGKWLYGEGRTQAEASGADLGAVAEGDREAPPRTPCVGHQDR